MRVYLYLLSSGLTCMWLYALSTRITLQPYNVKRLLAADHIHKRLEEVNVMLLCGGISKSDVIPLSKV